MIRNVNGVMECGVEYIITGAINRKIWNIAMNKTLL
jgi:hypothetical protein